MLFIFIESNNFEFPLPQTVYHTVDPNLNKLEDILTDQNMYSLHSWLAALKMERYTANFFNAGYHSIELLFLQMNSRYATYLNKSLEIH